MNHRSIKQVILILIFSILIGIISSASVAYFKNSIKNQPITDLLIEYEIQQE
ncbi:hypothetical protein [Clostridium sp. 1001271B_151109_B4]|uniref:hypothetical protein n=1 Tax=Clostridium sp. 1001271B_151109_B4 TaxID=2787148 RepID=UPI0018AA5B04|nr:hypothetical protein [Clostridium sp. 1001271B_151109_B4]